MRPTTDGQARPASRSPSARDVDDTAGSRITSGSSGHEAPAGRVGKVTFKGQREPPEGHHGGQSAT
eukprot:11224078-Lingulodinium_polyedra.AAC.1